LLRLQLAAETWKDAEAFRTTSALIGAAGHGSRTVAALGAGEIGADSRLARAPIRGRRRRYGYLPLTAENHRRKAEI
jgi:hypothetical protein